MQEMDAFWFGPFRLDVASACVWHGHHRVPLSPKAFAVLQVLVAEAGHLVTKETLLNTVWPQKQVSEAALTVCIRELRQAFNDDARQPTFIETLHRRGYRFLVTATPETESPIETILRSTPPRAPLVMVGRENELGQLQAKFAEAERGNRRAVFVTGEPGIGKTTLVDALMAEVDTLGQTWIARGQCVENYGAGEPYRPVLEALGQLYRTSAGSRIKSVLRAVAPMWLAQMPWLNSQSEFDALQQRLVDSRPERMIRELVEALEILTTQDHTLLLILEDLHWSDAATLELMDVLARRREPARLLIISTYRINEVYDNRHPLRRLSQELLLHAHAVELPLPYLSYAAVERYLTERFPAQDFAHELILQLYHRTEGSPLFLVAIIEHVFATGGESGERADMIEAILNSVPDNLQQMVEQKIEQLTAPEQEVLEAASVVGQEFTAAVVSAALELSVEQVEVALRRLVQQRLFLNATGVVGLPDGTVSESYRFIHALYREIIYRQAPSARRLRLHQRVSLRLEQGYGEQVEDIAAELAMHCELGWEFARAVQYRQLASRLALRRQDYREAATHLTTALSLLVKLPDTHERTQSELMIQHGLGTALMTIKGFSAPDVERALTRALELGQQVGASPRLFRVLVGLVNFHFVRGEFHRALDIAEQCIVLAQGLNERALLVRARVEIGKLLTVQGDVRKAHPYLEEAVGFYNTQQSRLQRQRNGFGPEMICRGYFSMVLLGLGYIDQALQNAKEAVEIATDLSNAFCIVIARHVVSMIHQFRREPRLVKTEADAIIDLAEEHGFQVYIALGKIQLGWVLAELEKNEAGIALIQEGIMRYRATGAMQLVPYFLIRLAESYGQVNQSEKGLETLDEARRVVEQTGERFYESELYRVKGTLLSTHSERHDPAVAHCFYQAVTVARELHIRWLELRAMNSLFDWQRQYEAADATREELATLYAQFQEGLDTLDLHEASALLNASPSS